MTDRPCSPAAATSLPPNRRGRLRNGAAPGDFLAAPRCGTQTAPAAAADSRPCGTAVAGCMAGSAPVRARPPAAPAAPPRAAPTGSIRPRSSPCAAPALPIAAAWTRSLPACGCAAPLGMGCFAQKSDVGSRKPEQANDMYSVPAPPLWLLVSAFRLLAPPLGMGPFRHFQHGRWTAPARFASRHRAKASSSAPSSAALPSVWA
jgi:hypothetical protein